MEYRSLLDQITERLDEKEYRSYCNVPRGVKGIVVALLEVESLHHYYQQLPLNTPLLWLVRRTMAPLFSIAMRFNTQC